MKITGCRFVKVTGRLEAPIGLDDGRPLQPADSDPAFATRPLRLVPQCLPDPDGVRRIRTIFAFLETDNGVQGTTTPIPSSVVGVIRETLLRWLIGRDPLQIEGNREFMFRSLGGHDVGPASTLNCVMWDIRGKMEGAPVYQLLGGPRQPNLVP